MIKILQGDAIEQMKTLSDESVHCCVTSPPYYGLRFYNSGSAEIGLEKSPDEYVQKMVDVFREVRRVLRKDGTCWLNLGSSYQSHPGDYSTCGGFQGNEVRKKGKEFTKYNSLENGVVSKGAQMSGFKPKDMVPIPWMVAMALQQDGWYLRQDIIWSKPNPMPESVTDRCTKAHEYVFLLAKSAKYYYDAEAIKEDSVDDESYEGRRFRNPDDRETGLTPQHNYKAIGKTYPKRNKRSVWTINTKTCKEAHFATFPTNLIRPMILAGCPLKGTVLDPFGGSGTTGMVAEEEGRNSILIELNPAYIEIAKRRTQQQGLFCK